MRGNAFTIIFSALFILYIIAEINKPKQIDWTVTISKTDKNPYGGFIIYDQLRHIFPEAEIQSSNTSFYTKINNTTETNTAYFFVGPVLRPTAVTTNTMKSYVSKGNYIIASANLFYTPFLDSLGVETTTPVYFRPKDSTSMNFVNPALKAANNYTFLQGTIDQYFSKIDSNKSAVLSINNHNKPVFIKVRYGRGAFFIHTSPICFSNYFLLFRDNASYTSRVLSFVPEHLSKIYWDEFYKTDIKGAATPLRFFLSNEYLRWFLRLAVVGIFLYIFFEMKRKQRVIPVMEPLKNSTLDFIKTVASVYYNEKNNREIADQKLSYFLDYIRNRFNLATNKLDNEFAESLQRKSGAEMEQTSELVRLLTLIQTEEEITDEMLLEMDKSIDKFSKQI